MVIAIGRPGAGNRTSDERLKEWGTRMWTFPEVLLSPGREIAIYTAGQDSPWVLPKNQFASKVWADAPVSKQLIDHYLGNINLSRLELSVLALQCLWSRQTTEYLPGDQTYALMGLLRVRPQIDVSDSPFQAFAR